MSPAARTMTMADRAAKLGLLVEVEAEAHGAGAGVTLHHFYRGGTKLYEGTPAEGHAFLSGYAAATPTEPTDERERVALGLDPLPDDTPALDPPWWEHR